MFSKQNHQVVNEFNNFSIVFDNSSLEFQVYAIAEGQNWLLFVTDNIEDCKNFLEDSKVFEKAADK
jgi:hypothetical protein